MSHSFQTTQSIVLKTASYLFKNLVLFLFCFVTPPFLLIRPYIVRYFKDENAQSLFHLKETKLGFEGHELPWLQKSLMFLVCSALSIIPVFELRELSEYHENP